MKPSFLIIAIIMTINLTASSPVQTAHSGEIIRDLRIVGFWEQQSDSAGGPRVILEINRNDAQEPTATIHTFIGTSKEGEFQTDAFSQQDSVFSFIIQPFSVLFHGILIDNGAGIHGKLINPDQTEQVLLFSRVQPQELNGLFPRPPGDIYSYHIPEKTNDGWNTGSLMEAGIDSGLVMEGIERVIAGDCGLLNSLLIVKDGNLLLEEYFYGYDSGTPHLISSNTKSICSLLIGIALDRGFIKSLDENVFSFYPQYEELNTDSSGKITLRHLLTMTAGYKLSGNIMEETDNRIRTALERDVIHEPGITFQYDEGSANLLAGIIKHATGMHADVFAEKYLFGPLGIITYNWEEEKQEGYPCCQGSLELLPRDMAKIGQLVLNRGMWNGKQIVSKEWIKESTTPKAKPDYGYMWWRGESRLDGKTIESVVATGIGSQFICIFPSFDAVVVMTGSNYHNNMTPEPIRILEPYILKAMVSQVDASGESIDKNPDFEAPVERLVTIRVVPVVLLKGSTIYITGNHEKLGSWIPDRIPMDLKSDGSWTHSFSVENNTHLEFKITRGSWETEALSDEGFVPPNMLLDIGSDTTVTVSVRRWKDNQ